MRRLLVFVLALLLASPAFAFLPPSYDDAPLRAVAFASAERGVAVGDHGTVWLTTDAGRTWERKKTGTKASLRAVCFINEAEAWAVGRTERANDTSTGVVFCSQDGGLTWSEATTVALPGLNAVTFFDDEKGIAAGDGTPACPSGLVATVDGGKTWAAVPGPRIGSWTGGTFTDLSNGTLVDADGKVWGYGRGKLEVIKEVWEGRPVRAVSVGKSGTVSVGDRGLADGRNSASTSWPNWDAETNEFRNLNLHAVSRRGDTVCAVGAPGSVALRSTDGGKEWKHFNTGWNLPLHAFCAASETDVYAVGELGAILKSSDAGKTWKVLRAGGQRAAVLFVNAHPNKVPLDVIAATGGRDGYHSAAVSVCGGDEHRLAAAVRASGGVGTGSCGMKPLTGLLMEGTPEEVLKHWGGKEDDVVRRLVLQFRMWQPEVVCLDALGADAGPAEQVVLKAAHKAFKLADDPKAFPEQFDTLGLKPFAPKKLLALCPPADAHVKLDNTEFARGLVSTPQGYCEAACGVLGAGSPPASRAYRLVSHRADGCEKHADLTTGFQFAEGGVARRTLPQWGGNLDEVFQKAKASADQRRTLEAVLFSADTQPKLERALGLCAGTLKTMPDDMACRTAVGLGRQLADAGKWVAARELFLLAVAKYGTFEESNEAMRWLLRYYSSGEARRRADAEGAVTLQYGVIKPGSTDVRGVGFTEAGDGPRLSDGETAQLWAKACLELEPKLKAFGTTASRDPAVMLSTLAAKRALGRSADAADQVAGWLKATPGATTAKPGADLWRDCIAAELWLANRTALDAQPKPLALCPKADAKPHLDGKLDDDCWKGMKPLDLGGVNDGTEYGTKAYFTYDDDYLYFAVECQHPAGKGQPKADKRRRDDDLRGRDRVDILLDLDRDYQTYFRFQIDQRGCVAEDCTGDRTWNPKWFVAADPTDTSWTAEIAIPRAELTGGAFKAGTTWGMNVTRVVPGAGCKAWSGPADARPRPEGLGLMQLHDPAKK